MRQGYGFILNQWEFSQYFECEQDLSLSSLNDNDEN